YLGEDTAEQLELMRSAFRVIRTVREKHACTQCDAIVQAPAPSRPIERGIAGPGLLVRVLTSKYAEHTPLYRQSEIYGRQGVELSRNTLVRWVAMTAERLRPLHDALNRYVMESRKQHTDDTPVKVLEPGSGKTRTGRLWVYVRDDRNSGSAAPPAAWFAYSTDRRGCHPQGHLAEWKGILQADAFAGYDALYESGLIREAACMAHARRKIHDEHVRRPTAMTTEALKRIAGLYAVEATIRGQPAEKRLAERQEKSVPQMKALFAWLTEQMETLSVHAELGKAFSYMLNHREAQSLCCEDGRVELDNNIAENTLRCVALWRRNCLFFGSDTGGQSAAILYSLLATCRLNGVDPESWLREVISCIDPVYHSV
ncbi:IS66 family transposase, partial [Escherichia coli]